MKKLLILPVMLALLISCGGETIENLQDNAESIIEDGTDDIFEYNDALLSEATIIEVEFVKIADLDEQDVSKEEFEKEALKSLDIISEVQDNLSKMEPFGPGGDDFLQATIEFALESEKLMKLYLGYAEQLAIPDEEWTDQDIDDFLEIFEPAELAYSDAYDNISAKQEVFASKNGSYVEEDASFDAQEIYDESK